MVNAVEVVVIVGQRGDVHQALDEDLGQLDEQAETGHRGDDAGIGFADAILHELALEPVGDVPRGFVGAALGHGALLTELIQAQFVVGIDARLGHARRACALDVLGLQLGADHATDRPMHQQIRIAPDRRGEMGIGLVVETEVTVVVRAVDRLAQRSEHHRLDQPEVRPLADLLEQRLVVRRHRIGLALGQGQPHLAEELAQIGLLFQGRRVMHPVQGRHLVLLEEFRSGHVGAQHAFLDQLVGIVALGRADLGYLAVGAKDDAGVLGVEIDRTAYVTSSQQHLVQAVELLQVRHHFAELLAQLLAFGRLGLLQHRRNLVVGQARVGVDDRLIELVAGHAPGGGDGHLADHGQAIHLGIERAKAVGQGFRQHGDNPLGEIHRVAALLRLGV